jgi:phosphoglycerate dehydrogenase-like enzyme
LSAKVLIIDLHAEIYAERLHREFPELQVVAAHDHPELPSDLSAVSVIISFGLAISDDIIARSRALKWIQSLATGVDHFLRCPSLKPDVLITSGRGIHGPPMREAVLYMMMAISRDATRQVGDNRAHVWERRFWNLLYGKTAVVVGVGIVGIAIAEALKALGMRVVGVTRTPRDIPCFAEMIPTSRLPDAAREADFLINIVPASDENAELFGRDVFAAMKPTAFFINAGRGQTVDEAALLDVLRERGIAGAALDVFQVEPLPTDSPFWDLPNVFITPHVGGYIIEYEDLILPLILDNMRLFLAGRQGEMQNIVAR